MNSIGLRNFLKENFRNQKKSKTVVLCLLLCFIDMDGLAGVPFSQRIQEKKPNQGSIIIYQESALQELLDGTPVTTITKPAQENFTKSSIPPITKKDIKSQARTTSDQTKSTESNNYVYIPSPSNKSGKKVYASGYRICLFTGGNSRKDKQDAYSTGYLFKSSFLNVPVYTQFRTPHWTCVAGNFKTLAEAKQFLRKLKSFDSFKNATIVKTRIQVDAD